MFDLTGTDTGGKASEGTMGRRVAVATHKGGARESEALLRADNMDNTLTFVAEAEVCDTEFLDIFFKGEALQPRILLLDKGGNVLDALSRFSGDILQRKSISIQTRLSSA